MAIVQNLSPRQRQILAMLGDGYPASDIATILGISVKTVSVHRRRLLEKLDLVNTAQLIRYAIIEELRIQNSGEVQNG